jgi:hypothetical protein
MADACAALGISLDWIAYGTSAPAIDELELAKALAEAEALAAPGSLSPLDLARAAHLIYMRALYICARWSSLARRTAALSSCEC